MPGGRFTLFPEGNELTRNANEFRKVANPYAPLPRELDKRLLATYVVEPGDVLLVQPADLDSPARLPSDQPVLADGTINLGRYGQLVVAGKTVEQIEAAVRAAVEAQTKNAGPITVRVVTRQSKVYYVLGEVNAPGAFPIQGRETVLDAIMAAGGLNDRAARRRIILSRPSPPASCRVVLPVCYNEVVQLGDTTTNYQVAPGDRIYVPTRTFWEEVCPGCLRKDNPPCCADQVPCAPAAGADPLAGGPCIAVLEKPFAPAPAPPVPSIPVSPSDLLGPPIPAPHWGPASRPRN
jgi:protein involved in polysaccharide export with SLBB domain